MFIIAISMPLMESLCDPDHTHNKKFPIFCLGGSLITDRAGGISPADMVCGEPRRDRIFAVKPAGDAAPPRRHEMLLALRHLCGSNTPIHNGTGGPPILLLTQIRLLPTLCIAHPYPKVVPCGKSHRSLCQSISPDIRCGTQRCYSPCRQCRMSPSSPGSSSCQTGSVLSSCSQPSSSCR